MLNEKTLMHWQQYVPWKDFDQVEKDLIISRILVDIFNHPLLQAEIILQGSVAIQKFVYATPIRPPEDIDLVRIVSGPIKPVLDAISSVLSPWLGVPVIEHKLFSTAIVYYFTSTNGNNATRIKIDINNTHNTYFMDLVTKEFTLNSPWYSGSCTIKSYHPNELIGAKLHALYSRVRGRDLFDICRAIESPLIDTNKVVEIYEKFCERRRQTACRLGFQRHLLHKYDEQDFIDNLKPVLPPDVKIDFKYDLNLVMNELICKISSPQTSYLPSFNMPSAVAALSVIAATGIVLGVAKSSLKPTGR